MDPGGNVMDSTPDVPAGAPDREPAAVVRIPRRSPWWQGKIGPAFWTIASLFSLTVNIILIVLLILVSKYLFPLKDLISQQLLGGLYYNFVRMDQARIKTEVKVTDTIRVKDSIPVVFDLPLAQETRIVLTQRTPINGATIFLNGQAVPIDIILPAGTGLNIRLNMTVPVNQTVPVVLDVPIELSVPVEIPLQETELHEPFIGLQDVISPYYWQLGRLPDSWEEVIRCALRIEGVCAPSIEEERP
jgi:hypothetical protein